MRYAIVFPGQGSQQVGMAKDFFTEFRAVKEVFAKADAVLGYKLSDLILEGPMEELTLTENAQPAILTASYAIWQVVKEFVCLEDVVAMAGHSLGEYTALVCSQALAFEDAIRLVHLRGKFMQEAVKAGEGMMIAVLGLSLNEVEDVLASFQGEDGVAEIANINAKEQVVVSGNRDAVSRLIVPLKKAGAKRVVELKVSAPFHCSLMKKAAQSLSPYLKETTFIAPKTKVFCNVTAKPYPEDASKFAALLEEQITLPVRWVDEVENICLLKPDVYLEVGPGRILRALIARIIPDAYSFCISRLEEFKSLLPLFTGEKTLSEY